jgi:choline dehydrogenase-like flavoprotein
LIVGAGASGAAVAWSLAETRMKILCLEQGDWVRSTEFPSNGRDWEARRYAEFDISPNRRARDTDYPVHDDNSLMKIANFNGVGGGTILFTAHYPRMHPSDFRVRTLDGVADDWPIDYRTLEPYWPRTAASPASPASRAIRHIRRISRICRPCRWGKTGTRYARAMNELGWHIPSWPRRCRMATNDGRGKCINLGHCTPGCAQGAKASVDVTYWPQALRARVELRTRCRVREVATDEHGMASGVVYYDANGAERFQGATRRSPEVSAERRRRCAGSTFAISRYTSR